MKRAAIALLVGFLVAASITPAQAAKRSNQPPRYRRAPMAQNFVIKYPDGRVETRKAYPGYDSHFPPPAYLYYGYPHSGDDSGPGLWQR